MLVKLLRFYQQYTIEDFLNMDIRHYKTLINGMEQVKAEEHLVLMDAVSYPQMNQKARRKSHKNWYKQAYPENFQHKPVKTTDLELF